MGRCTSAVRMDLVVCMIVLVVVSVSMGLPWVTYSLQNRGEPIGVRKSNIPYQEFRAVLPAHNK